MYISTLTVAEVTYSERKEFSKKLLDPLMDATRNHNAGVKLAERVVI